MITILNEVIPLHTVSVSKSDPRVLEIDVETAWKEMNLDSGWSNEVEVKICLTAAKDWDGEILDVKDDDRQKARHSNSGRGRHIENYRNIE